MIGIGCDGKNFYRYSAGGAYTGDVVLPGGEFILGACAAKKLRELLAIPAPTPGLTAEQAEVARIEAELEQARTDELISGHNRFAPNKGVFDSWCYVLMFKKHPSVGVQGSTRLEAARAALARVRELRAEADANKLPEPEEMSRCKLMEELAERGACAKAIDSKWWTVHLSDGTDTRLCTDNDQGLRAALRRARELDGA